MSDIDSFNDNNIINDDFDDLNTNLDFNINNTRSNIFKRFRYYFKNWYFNNNNNNTLFNNNNNIPLFDLNNNNDTNDIDYTIDNNIWNKKFISNNKFNKFIKLFLLSILFLIITLLLFKKLYITNTNNTPTFTYKTKFNPFLKYNNGTHDFNPITILLIINGFNPLLINNIDTPTLHNLYTLNHNISTNINISPYMLPSFPTLSLPNLYSMFTGKLPIDHNIINNKFFDHLNSIQFIDNNICFNNLSDSITIWENIQSAYHHTNTKFNVKTAIIDNKISPILNCPNDSSNIAYPYYHYHLQDNNDNHKLNKIFNLIDDFDINNRPQFIITNFNSIYNYSYNNGYNLKNDLYFKSLLNNLDTLINNTLSNINNRNLFNFTNLLIVSDQGMSNINITNSISNNNNKKNHNNNNNNDSHILIWENDLIKNNDIKKMISHSYIQDNLLTIYPKKSIQLNQIYSEIKLNLNITNNLLNFKVYLNNNLPDNNWNNKKNVNIPPIWVIPNINYTILSEIDLKNYKKNKKTIIARSGYDKNTIEMRSLFIGLGPFFNNKNYINPFNNIYIYDLINQMNGISKSNDFLLNTLTISKNSTSSIIDNFTYINDVFRKGTTYNNIFSGIYEIRENTSFSNAETNNNNNQNSASDYDDTNNLIEQSSYRHNLTEKIIDFNNLTNSLDELKLGLSQALSELLDDAADLVHQIIPPTR